MNWDCLSEWILSKYGINRDNIKQVIQNYLQEKAGTPEV